MHFLKVPCMAIYIMKIGIWNGSQTMWDSFQISVFNAKNLPFLVFLKPYLHAQTLVCVRRLLGCVHKFMLAYAGLGFLLAFIFQKNLFLAH